MSYKDRAKSLKLLSTGYTESAIAAKEKEIERKQAMTNIELNEVEQRHPYMMMSAGYRAIAEANKAEQAEKETTIQFYEDPEKDAETLEIELQLAKANVKLAELEAKLNA